MARVRSLRAVALAAVAVAAIVATVCWAPSSAQERATTLLTKLDGATSSEAKDAIATADAAFHAKSASSKSSAESTGKIIRQWEKKVKAPNKASASSTQSSASSVTTTTKTVFIVLEGTADAFSPKRIVRARSELASATGVPSSALILAVLPGSIVLSVTFSQKGLDGDAAAAVLVGKFKSKKLVSLAGTKVLSAGYKQPTASPTTAPTRMDESSPSEDLKAAGKPHLKSSASSEDFGNSKSVVDLNGIELNTSEWSYTGACGPEKWPTLFGRASGKGMCDGYSQSPINIDAPKVTMNSEYALDIQYMKVYGYLQIQNTGRTVELTGSGLLPDRVHFQSETYWLKEFHFHRGSEHRINGMQFPLEAQLVHKSVVGAILIVSVLFEEGKENSFLEALHWDMVPKKGEKLSIEALNPRDMLPSGDLEYYQYRGSFTVPPCTEAVQWIVLKGQSTVSEKQMEAFPFAQNYRKPQALNKREVQFMSKFGHKKPVVAVPITDAPTRQPSEVPTKSPTEEPSGSPSALPSQAPSATPSAVPTRAPSLTPTDVPISPAPSLSPTGQPSFPPTDEPTSVPTFSPTEMPTIQPSAAPSNAPTNLPTVDPTLEPTDSPTGSPTEYPTTLPPTSTDVPTAQPTEAPTETPTNSPTAEPSLTPTNEPSRAPTAEPTYMPTASPTEQPTSEPSTPPSEEPTEFPTEAPTQIPTSQDPTREPTEVPTASPTDAPTADPTQAPTEVPTVLPTPAPTMLPTLTPTTMDQNPHVLKLKAAQEAAQEAHIKALQAQKKALQDEMQSQHDLMKKRMQAAKVDAKKALQEQKQALQDQMESQHGALKKHISSEVDKLRTRHVRAESRMGIIEKSLEDLKKEVTGLHTPTPTATPTISEFSKALHGTLKSIDSALDRIGKEMSKPDPPVSIDTSPAAQWALKYGAVAGPLSLPKEKTKAAVAP